jgi:Domain of unknown function (DUF1906)
MTAPALNRSFIEFAKRCFLDRLTVDAQGLFQPWTMANKSWDLDAGPGDLYDYGGCYDPFDLGIGADCSGSSGIYVGAAINGPDPTTGMQWARMYSTETFPGPFQGFRQTTQADLLNNYYPIKICIMHGGGGPDSHMNTWIDGWLMESNGTSGTCTLNFGAIPQDSSYWNDWWVYDNPVINEDFGSFRQGPSYPLGLDYAGGRIAGADLAANGINFVMRYLTDGGSSLPGKLLLPTEYADLMAHGINVGFNYETDATFMLEDNGAADANAALATIRELPGAPANPVVYFSADDPSCQDNLDTVIQFCTDAGSVLGGPNGVGVYGSFAVVQAVKNAGVANYIWQTEAWSGFGQGTDPHVDSRLNIMQRNNLGYMIIDGVQCDINEARTVNFGAAAAPMRPVSINYARRLVGRRHPHIFSPAKLAALSD